jgi:hypothetical protein
LIEEWKEGREEGREGIRRLRWEEGLRAEQ